MRYIILAAALCSFIIRAAEPKITVAAQGSTVAQPAALEVIVTLTEKSEDAKGALLNLKTTRDKIAAKLSPLGVAADQIQTDPAYVLNIGQNSRRAMQMRTSNRLKRSETAAAKPEIQMQQTLRARIPLKGTDVDALTLEGEELKAKVTSAKLVDDNKDESESEEADTYNSNQNASPINMYFFAPLTDALKEKALADAVKKASEDASRVAKAMGKNNAELTTIILHHSGQGGVTYQNHYDYDGWNGRQQHTPARDGLYSYTASINYQVSITAEYLVR